MPRKIFNVAGPCVPGDHYMLDPFRGIDSELMDLIDSKQYFVIHAARQCGKTTLLQALVRQINKSGAYYALYCTVEASSALTNPAEGIPAIIKRMKAALSTYCLPDGFAENADFTDYANMLNTSLVQYCRSLDKPLVIFFDEADSLANGTLINFLRQLRDGYVNRAVAPFAHSVALVGMRNLRDYKAHVRPDSETLGSSSPFNIIKKSINLRNFTKAEVADLYAQHTAESGQTFEPDVVEYVFEQTQGQPWLANAIACECVEEITKKDYSKPITRDLATLAIHNLVLARGVHFDSLLERLKEPRVRKIVSPLIMGEEVADKGSDDYLYTKDLGLIRENSGKIEPANPVYAELIIRALSWNTQDSIKNTHEEYVIPRYIKDGKMDMDFLMKDFQSYWRENSEIWEKRYEADLYQYHEAAPHLVLHAFLRRIVNGNGQVISEMALGTKRADLCIVYKDQKYPIELKILQSMRNLEHSQKQLLAYMDRVGSNVGWLVIFDRDTAKSWNEKIYSRKETVNGKEINIVGC
jgi:SpoVK/Ycf46/Vps4 family AAA+-type ATPase